MAAVAYLRGHVDIRTATAARMMLRRVPRLRQTPPKAGRHCCPISISILAGPAVASFIAEQAVSGERRVAAIDGKVHIADGRAQVALTARTIAGAARAGGDVLTLRLDAVPEANPDPDFDLRVDAPAGGVLGALGGLREPLVLRAGGKGDWRAWDGTFRAELGGTDLARLVIGGRGGAFTLRGPVAS